MRKLFIALLAALSVSAALSAATVSVSGSSTVYMTPDTAAIGITASSLADSTEVSMSEAAEMINAAVSMLAADYGIGKADISTSYIAVSPEYTWKDGEQILLGQRAEQSVSVTLRDIAAIGDVYASLMSIDGISVSSPVLDKEDKTTEYREARMGAVEDAYSKAAHYAEAAGYAVGDLVSISDGSGAVPMYARASNVMLSADAIAESGGVAAAYYMDDIAVSSSVSVVWELGDDSPA